ncbi:response regulator transcription factor [Burkholderia cenocepacia]|uniref:response regulator transcription factor n=1 Tax=Burkholderia cenocepacia TaxID=95486 RepID=UPI0026546856|nr:winged helix-turn-helix domain-containing protein [Burkholderia cenocepacia]MDN7455550.1 winged helix-turn-helix domain-containing protein [Burkholderia cenocepacia]
MLSVAMIGVEWPEYSLNIEEVAAKCNCNAKVIRSGEELIKSFSGRPWEVLVIGEATEDLSGVEIIRSIRSVHQSNVPIILIGHSMNDADISASLETGADIYLDSSVSDAVVAAHILAVRRRSGRGNYSSQVIKFDNFEFNLATNQVMVRGEIAVRLQRRQFELALELFKNLNSPISRARIRERIWRMSEDVASNSINSSASTLRRKLGLYPEYGYILTVTANECRLSRHTGV